MPFNGFSRKTIDFLVENKLNNSKAWFEEHRDDYNRFVLNPMRELVVDLTPTMLSIDGQFTVEPKINKTLSKIYRDTRFSRDKSLFRDEMWITFMRNKRFWEGLPGYYFLFGPDGLVYGFGYYEASREAMECFRKMIVAGEKPFLKAFKAYRNQKEYHIEGACYKRTKYPDEPEEIREWLDRKNISFECKMKNFELLYSPELVKVLADGFQKLKPVYDFICAVEERKKRPEPIRRPFDGMDNF